MRTSVLYRIDKFLRQGGTVNFSFYIQMYICFDFFVFACRHNITVSFTILYAYDWQSYTLKFVLATNVSLLCSFQMPFSTLSLTGPQTKLCVRITRDYIRVPGPSPGRFNSRQPGGIRNLHILSPPHHPRAN